MVFRRVWHAVISSWDDGGNLAGDAVPRRGDSNPRAHRQLPLTGSLNVIAVLPGILVTFSGIFHPIRVLDPDELRWAWLGIAGLLFVMGTFEIIGGLLPRHARSAVPQMTPA
jgi:hypothetical protein